VNTTLHPILQHCLGHSFPTTRHDEVSIKLPPRLWHYTTAQRLEAIARDGVLRQAVAGVSGRERPAVWFTTSAEWEPTANKIRRLADGTLHALSTEETAFHGGGLVRFEVATDVAPVTWVEHRRKGGIAKRMADALEKAARRVGSNSSDWRLSYTPVPRQNWLSVELFWSGAWVKVGRREQQAQAPAQGHRQQHAEAGHVRVPAHQSSLGDVAGEGGAA
jgi:hypothetical protein